MDVSAIASARRLMGEGSEREKRAAKDGWNKRQPTGAESAKVPGFLEGPLGEARSGAGAKQSQLSSEWEPGSQEHTVVDFLCPPALPTLGWRRCLRGGVTERKVSSGCASRRGPRGARRALLLRLPRGVCAAGSEPGPAVTALRRGSAPRAGPRRGPRWHTTGADLEGRTQGSALPGPYTPQDTVIGEVRQHLGTEWANGGKEMPQSARAWHSAAAVPGLPIPQKPASKKYWLCVLVS